MAARRTSTPNRRLEFRIVVYSTPGCPCAYPSKAVTAVQTFKKNQQVTGPNDFQTPNPNDPFVPFSND